MSRTLFALAFLSLLAAGWSPHSLAITCQHPQGGIALPFYGDLNASGTVNVADTLCSVIYLLATQAGQPASAVPCMHEPLVGADLNCNGTFDLSDVLLSANLGVSGAIPAALNPDGAGCPAACASCAGGGPSCLIAQTCVAGGDRTGTDGCQLCDPVSSASEWTADTPTEWFRDADDDDFGADGDSQLACVEIGNYRAPVGGDCDDGDNTVYPGADELCDGVDNNCDGTTDEGCGAGGSILDPLDGLPVAAAAFSVRRLSASYAGPSIRVRRSSDQTQSDIGFTGGGQLDTAALLTFCGAGTCAVTTWYDQTGNGRHFSQASPGLQPIIVQSGVMHTKGGQPTLRFEAQWMTAAPANWGTNFSVFLVHGFLEGGYASVTGSTYQRILETNYQTHFYLGSNGVPDKYQVIVNTPNSPFGTMIGGDVQGGVLRGISSVTATGSTDFYLDGTEIDTMLTGTISDQNYTLYLNRYYSTANHMINGYFSELLWFNSALDPSQRIAVESSQVCYFGLDETAYDGNGNGVADLCDAEVATNCTQLRQSGQTTSGLHYIDPDGAGGGAPYQVYCNLHTQGGGWTLALNLDTSDGHVMWWANPLWTNGSSYGDVGTPFSGDHVSPAWANLSDATRLLLVVHNQGSVVGWKQFAKSNGDTLLQSMSGGDNTLLTSGEIASNTGAIWVHEHLVRDSTELYANHCNTAPCTTGPSAGGDGDRISSNEAKPGNNQGGGLGNWHDMGQCCSAAGYGSGKTCTGAAFRTVSEAQTGWCPGYGGTFNQGYFGTDTFAPATCTKTDTGCTNANWSGASGVDYDYALYLGHESLAGASAAHAGVDCADILAQSPLAGDGVYWVNPSGALAFQVYCDMTTDGGGWTLFAVGSSFSSGHDVLSITSAAASPTRVLNQARAQALIAASSHLFRVSNAARTQSLFIQDGGALFSSVAGAGYGRAHYWTSAGPTVTCATNYGQVTGGAMAAASTFSMSCDANGVASHSCGSGNGWILLHSGGTYNYSGAHPCAFGGGQSSGLLFRWVR